MDIWVQTVGGKKKRKSQRSWIPKSNCKGIEAIKINFSEDIDEIIKSHLNASNADLYAQLQNERHTNKKMRKELDLLMKHVYTKLFSNERSSQEDNQAYENESDDDSNSMNEKNSDPNT
ncbi:hypothetical protein MTR67_043372 [Solanum verrucosum]|uniref:Uncharacterized protein n=1 Tax=Solanum verrucosum TaxID=315347 RepID=A0AAF0UPA3_SOLVR|nr:hypothetical protein MTR67_043372 [Solanum verrucosum]